MRHISIRFILIWTGLSVLLVGPILAIAASPLLAYRQPIYVTASFAGGIAMALLILQPLLANGDILGLSNLRGRSLHKIAGTLLLLMLALHVLTLWITSPPDVIDALILVSPTPFSIWGVLAFWGIILTAVLASRRRKLTPQTWRRAHVSLAVIISLGTVLHVILIDGTMDFLSKASLSISLFLTTGFASWRVWRARRP